MMSSPRTPADGPRDDSPFRRPDFEAAPQWEPMPTPEVDAGLPTPSGYVLQGSPSDGSVSAGATGADEGVEEAEEPARRWRPGLLFGVVLGILVVAGLVWAIFFREQAPGPEPAPTAPIPSTWLAPPSWDPADMTPPGNAQLTTPPVPALVGWVDPQRGISMNGGGANVQRLDANTAVILTSGHLQHVNLADGVVNWTVEAEGRPVVSAESGAVLEVAPDGSTISRVVLTGDELSRGKLRGNPALCGDLVLDVASDRIDAYDPTDLTQRLWGIDVSFPEIQGGSLDCWADGRELLIGERPNYFASVIPGTREARSVFGVDALDVRAEVAEEGTTMIGPFGRTSRPGVHVSSLASAQGVAVTTETKADGTPVMSGYSVDSGEQLWSAFGVVITQVLTVGEAVVGVTPQDVVMVSLDTGGVQALISRDEREVAPDAHGNVCAYTGASYGQPLLKQLTCVRPADEAGRSLTLEGDWLEVTDGVWLLHRDGELDVFQ
ncbi:MAG: hypothetical protein Q4G35_00825 [Propionibacteriaceae bacterium]|nr:hypothetical protein [Propionibacteriaceae bacterium]